VGKPWVKVWCEMRQDRKLRGIDPAWRWAWCGLLMVAAAYADDGRLIAGDGIALNDDDLADELALPLATWQAAKAHFLARRMLIETAGGLVIPQYQKRQASSDPSAAERKRRQRERDTSRVMSRVTRASRHEQEQQTDRQTEQQNSEDRTQKIEDRTVARTPPPPVNGNGAHKDTEAAVSGGGGVGEFDAQLNPERFVAASYVKLVAPDFRGLGSFITETNCKLVGWCTLHVGAAIAAKQEIDNPAGLIRTLVRAGSYPDMPGYLRDKWAADVQAARNGEYAEDTNVPY